MVKEEVAVLIALVRRHRRAVGAAVGWAVDDEIPGAVEEEVGLAAVRRVPPGLLDALHVHALGVLGIFLGRAIQKAAMPTGEGDQDGHFFFNHPERGGQRRVSVVLKAFVATTFIAITPENSVSNSGLGKAAAWGHVGPIKLNPRVPPGELVTRLRVSLSAIWRCSRGPLPDCP